MTRRQQSRQDLADLILDGKLTDLLRTGRDRGDSYDTIALALRLRGVEVSGETVRQWYLALEPAS